ncbi:MAG: DNA recombination protein RmuC [Burkholderiales bacterium]
MEEVPLIVFAVGVILGLALVGATLALLRVQREIADLRERQQEFAEVKHREVLAGLHEGLMDQAERMGRGVAESSDRVREQVTRELGEARESLQSLRLSQQVELSTQRESLQRALGELATVLKNALAGQARADQEAIQSSLHRTSHHLIESVAALTRSVDTRLDQISGRVAERLDEGFKNTNDTFVRVMERLATIDEAQKKIDGLTTNVVSLQELLGDKRSRGAFGEVQLEALVRNVLPAQAFAMQYTLPNGARADCVLKLPEPTGLVAVDSKFPLENYHRMLSFDVSELERVQAQRLFKADIKRHVDDIGRKYIIPEVTSDGAVMFVPAEAVFAEIHAYHADVVDYAQRQRVWIVSPTTLMAVLNTARAVIKDVETRKQVHIIKDELSKLGREFGRFDERMRKLADHIRQAHEDAERVQVTSQKISQRFAQIESVELANGHVPALELPADSGGRTASGGS